MVILKKIKASSLNEILIATVIIILVFGITMAVLSNLMKGFITNDSHKKEVLIHELIYKYRNKKLKIPYTDQNESLLIAIEEKKIAGVNWIEFSISSKGNTKKLTRKIISNEKN